ncbi:MAG: hypothetical protein ABIK65_09445 [Candidatus Eisenbacteria bacterium]
MVYRIVFRLSAAFFAAAVLFILAREAGSVPRYSARYGQKCLLCHQSPTGGGMRSLYASQFLVPNEIAARPYGDESLELPDPGISRDVTIGADLRTLAVYGDEQKEENNFFQMQGDVYLHFQLDRRFSAYFDRGMSGTYEMFGTGYVLPANGYFKAGRFTPAYGWRFADHTMFTRREIGFFDPPAHSDVGIELGFFPGDGSLNLAVMNGAPGLVRDVDGVRAYFARTEIRRRLGPVNIAGGLSGLAVDEEEFEPWAAGPFGYASWGSWTWVGEWDWKREAGPGGATAFVTSHEFTRRIIRGVDLRATYDFYDPDRDRETGARTRAGIGIDTLPYPYLGVLAMVNFHDYDEGIDVTGDDRVQANLVLHFLY